MQTIKNKLKSLFSLSDGVDTSRRKFIKDAGALAALTVVAANTPSWLKVRELKAQIASGRVIGQTLYLYEPVVIDLPNVVFENCRFVAMADMPYMMETTERARDFRVQNCFFDGNDYLVGGIRVAPQGNNDMTTTLRSAMDLASNADSRPVILKSGVYKMDEPVIRWKGREL